MELLFFKIAITIFLLSIIQSLIGIGLLIVGTPLLLSYNLDFFETLQILLPCSLIVSFYQLLANKNKEKITKSFKKIFLFWCLPFVPLGLVLTFFFKEKINFKLLIGCLIILILIFKKIYKFKKISEVKKKYISVFIGFFHGLTNLGGTLLSLFLLINKSNNIKKEIDFSYLFLAGTQFFFLIIFFDGEFQIKNLILITISLLSCLVSNNICHFINKNRFMIALNILIFLSALIVIISNFR